MKFILEYKRAPGDTLVLTALVRDLKLTYGDDIEIGIRCSYPDLWKNNPYIAKTEPAGAKLVRLSEGYYIRQSRAGVRQHYITAFFRDFTDKTGVVVHPTLPHGDLHLSEYEKQYPIVRGKYWVIVPGGKTDATVKVWPTSSYQEVVRLGAERNWHFLQEGAAKPRHFHPPLSGALSLVGRTTIRDLILNIYHSQGLVCGITLPMHIAAALQKPCVVLAGGREEPWWEHYANEIDGQFGPRCSSVTVPHRFLNTFGQLDCCETRGCWRQRVVKLHDGDMAYEKSLCQYPVVVPGEPTAKCMSMITPQQVVDAIDSYGGAWSPVPPPIIVRSPSLTAAAVARPAAVPHLQRSTAAPDESKTRMTCCVLLHGGSPAEFDMHQRCIDSIVGSTPTGALDFRIACNQIGEATRAYLQEKLPQAVRYEDYGTRRKYPAMREMFHDRLHPITTDWTLWFDDDTWVVDPLWYQKLSEAQETAADDVGCFGTPLFSRLQPHQLTWFRQASWFNGRQFRTAQGRDAPNGTCIHFPVGWFWCVRTSAIAACDIPCKRLNHNGGDVTIGEQLHQHGFRTVSFNNNKSQIYTPPKSRRNYSERFPWI